MNDNNFRKLADMILDIVEGKLKKKPQAYDTQAVVRRVDARTGTAYVHIPNGVDETPVRLTIDAEAGDTVQVRVADGRAWLTGNRTAPPTDDAEALVAKAVAAVADKNAEAASTKAAKAQETAEAVSGIAESAMTEAQDAKTIAGNTEQHFWFTSTGTDTGAHITEVTQEEFTDPTDPNYQSGGNLLARTNGIAVRDGLTELASFGQESVIGKLTDNHIKIDGTKLGLYLNSGALMGHIMHIGRTIDGTIDYGVDISSTDVTDKACLFLGDYGHVFLGISQSSADTNLIMNSSYALINKPLKLQGHNTEIGATLNGTNVSSLALTTGTTKYLSSFSLPNGTWVITGKVGFPATSATNKAARVNISSTSADTSMEYSVQAVMANVQTHVECVRIVKNTSGTQPWYLNAFQNSGSQLTATNVHLEAVRIA